MHTLSNDLTALLDKITECTNNQTPIPEEFFDALQNHPEFGLAVLNWLSFEHNLINVENDRLVSMLQFMEFTLSQLKASLALNTRGSDALLEKFNQALSQIILNNPNLNLIRALFNIFIDAELEINEEIKENYLQLLSDRLNEIESDDNTIDIRDIDEDSDISAYEIAHALFIESSALPQDYINAFLQDLIDVGSTKSLNTAVLFLLHPLANARKEVLENLVPLFAQKTLSETALGRLKKISHWLKGEDKEKVTHLIKLNEQRNVKANYIKPAKSVEIYATEIDGAGNQAMFFVIKRSKSYQSAGLVLRKGQGIKDAWLSVNLSKEEAFAPIKQGKEQGLILRKVDKAYADLAINHSLSQAVAQESLPDIYALELSDALSSSWKPKAIDFNKALIDLAKKAPEINRLEWQEKSLQRSKKWPHTKSNYTSWFIESGEIDKVVNQNSSFKNGIKFCDIEKASRDIVSQFFEQHRDNWLAHFYWLALWASVKSRKNELFWKDCLFIAKALSEGSPMSRFPILDKIAKESIVHSLETMEMRKSHLN
jgi:hypothetical protein